MIINDFSYTKVHLETVLKQLKEGYAEGNEALNFSVTYGKRVRLTDDVFNMEGFMVIGYQEYHRLVERLGTEDVRVLTNEIDTLVQQHRGVLYQKHLPNQIEDLQRTTCKLKKAYIGDIKVMTYKDLKDHFRADRELVMSLDRDMCIKVMFRGDSVYVQGYRGMLLTIEEFYLVGDKGEFTPTLSGIYNELKSKMVVQTY